eukprot:TRINITY_DN1327_c0_g1_i1.p1 TRINITY_DN1327_c0_g1~~TRINITY_DN1327_c0_g1_i1.p1  ORF type:complete len:102 (-),score=25.43 TRINITY_DN1327_c0_g1_i1:104-409(-)
MFLARKESILFPQKEIEPDRLDHLERNLKFTRAKQQQKQEKESEKNLAIQREKEIQEKLEKAEKIKKKQRDSGYSLLNGDSSSNYKPPPRGPGYPPGTNSR